MNGQCALPAPEAGRTPGRNGEASPGVHSDAPASPLSTGERAAPVPEPTLGEKTKGSRVNTERAMNEKVREIAERERARRPGHDPTVQVRYVNPTVLKRDRIAPPPTLLVCEDCSAEFPYRGRGRPRKFCVECEQRQRADRARKAAA